MSLGERLRAVLVVSPAVTALVNARIFPQVLPQDVTYPAVRYYVPSDVPLHSFTGFSLRQGRVQVDAFAKKYREAHALADAIEGALSGADAPPLVASVMSRGDGYEDETELHRVSIDVWVALDVP